MNIPTKWIKDYIDLPEDLKIFTDRMSMIGHLLDKTTQTDTDIVIDLELRGNRADCHSILALARESHAVFGGRFDIPKTNSLPTNKYSNFEVKIQNNSIHRFKSVIIKNLKVGPSPEWMQERIKNYGMEPINNIVDITNYVMIESGMPMHAFDLEQMGGNSLILRNATENENFVTFDGSEKKLSSDDVVFAGEDGRVLGLVGIIGSKDSGISDKTVDILLECAGYDRVMIRKTIFRHSLHTEAGLRHSHDLSAELCDYALERATDLIIELAGEGDRSKIQGLDDQYPHKETQKIIEYKTSETKRLGGVEIKINDQIEILRRLQFEVNQIDDNTLDIRVPLIRTDIFESADIVEEVLRIWGYENIPSKTLSSEIPDPIISKELIIEDKIRDNFVSFGVNEVILAPLAKIEEFQKTDDQNIENIIGLLNPSSSEHTHLRTNMFTGLLQATQKILDRGDEKVEIFEIGKIYLKNKLNIIQKPHKVPFPYIEIRKAAGVFAHKNNKNLDFYTIKGYLETYFYESGILNLSFQKAEDAQFDLIAKIYQGDLELGRVGLLKNNVTQNNFDIKWDVYAFELDIENISKAKTNHKTYTPYSVYPAIEMDMSLFVGENITADSIKNIIKTNGTDLVRSIRILDVYEKDNQKSLLFNITYQSKDRTLSIDEVNIIHLKIANILEKELKVEMRGKEVLESAILKINENSITGEELTIINNSGLMVSNNQFIVIGQIISIEKHPNADRLVIAKINVGKSHPENTMSNEYLQIITGAPNITSLDLETAKGLLVPVALPGAIVKSHKTGEEIKIKISKLRDVISEGMLCSADELGIENPGYDGIMLLDEKYNDKIGEIFE